MTEIISWNGFKQSLEEVIKEEEKRKFITHLVVYGAANLLFIILNLIYAPNVLWFFYPLIGWGVMLVLHYLNSIHWIDSRIEETEAKIEYNAKLFRKKVNRSMKKK